MLTNACLGACELKHTEAETNIVIYTHTRTHTHIEDALTDSSHTLTIHDTYTHRHAHKHTHTGHLFIWRPILIGAAIPVRWVVLLPHPFPPPPLLLPPPQSSKDFCLVFCPLPISFVLYFG